MKHIVMNALGLVPFMWGFTPTTTNYSLALLV